VRVSGRGGGMLGGCVGGGGGGVVTSITIYNYCKKHFTYSFSMLPLKQSSWYSKDLFTCQY